MPTPAEQRHLAEDTRITERVVARNASNIQISLNITEHRIASSEMRLPCVSPTRDLAVPYRPFATVCSRQTGDKHHFQ